MNMQGIPIPLRSKRIPSREVFLKWPIKSPFENAKHIYLALSKKYCTKLYHFEEKVKIRFEQDDIFLGHPYFPHIPGKYGVTELATISKVRPKIFALITPLHCDTTVKTTHINKAFLDSVDRLMPTVDILFAIMGKYWWDQWDKSPYAHWKPKMVRLDMAVDVKEYPFIKKKFNKPGYRRFLYIGRNDSMKGIDFLQNLAFKLKNYEFGWIGTGPDIPGVKRISGQRQLDPEYMSNVSENYDFFISPSLADPNPTTILESMAWGFPVICTPQSGYYETSYLYNIHRNDIGKSLNILKQLQYANEEELVSMAIKARSVVEKEHTWEIFTNKLLEYFEQ